MATFLFRLNYPAVAILKGGVVVTDEAGVKRPRIGYISLPSNANGDQFVPMGRIAHAWLRLNAGLPVSASDYDLPDEVWGRGLMGTVLTQDATYKRIHDVAVTRAKSLNGSDVFTTTFRVHSMAMAENVGIGNEHFPEFGSATVTQAEFSRPVLEGIINEEEQNFAATVKTKISVDKLVSQIEGGAEFSFDYMMLVVVASLLAGVGLATDNTVVIVASMLVSPLMGPILGITFGSYMGNYDLLRTGLRTEVLGLLLCIVSGLFCGVAFSAWGPVLGWPNNEMASRGVNSGLLIGMSIAIPSGVGVALSVIGANTSSLVGVAISASLLPPAVNCGMFWAYALLGPPFADASLDTMDMLRAGAISFSLTIVNIVCIIIVAAVMFKIKEVAPIKGKGFIFRVDERERAENQYRKTMANPALGKAVLKILQQERGVDVCAGRSMLAKDATAHGSVVDLFQGDAPTPQSQRRRGNKPARLPMLDLFRQSSIPEEEHESKTPSSIAKSTSFTLILPVEALPETPFKQDIAATAVLRTPQLPAGGTQTPRSRNGSVGAPRPPRPPSSSNASAASASASTAPRGSPPLAPAATVSPSQASPSPTTAPPPTATKPTPVTAAPPPTATKPTPVTSASPPAEATPDTAAPAATPAAAEATSVTAAPAAKSTAPASSSEVYTEPTPTPASTAAVPERSSSPPAAS